MPRFDRRAETVSRTLSRNNWQRRFSVATVHRHQQVGLFGLRWQSGAWSAALHVDDDHRQLQHQAESHAFALKRDSRSTAGRDGHRSTEGSSDRRTNGCDFVLCLESANTEILVLGKLVQNVAGRRDWIRAKEQILVAEFCRGDQTPSQRLVAHHVLVVAFFEFGCGNLKRRSKIFCGFAVIPTSFQCQSVRFGNFRSFLAEFIVDESKRRFHVAAVKPEHQTHRKEVLATVGKLGRQSS